jgi:phosphinothricin acetyltransferase
MMIRPVAEDDFVAIASITNHYITTTAIHFAYEPVTAEELAELWRAHPGHPWFVASDRQGVVGYAKSGVWRDRMAYSWTAEVGVYVSPHARGRGLGSGLYDALLEELARRGFRSAVAGITLPNEASIALHRKAGFERVGVFHDAGWKLGAWHAVEFWQKRFATGPAGPGGSNRGPTATARPS